ncbi:hypothetical protein NDU88_003081 [Pleurodeles waltl]|uniref:Uncharacterized protein n=1 Tax=Pleurodeles waltl TaxID=8319 RepID=A0AAV7SG21_PLEWA|nr:hypothetical protein NDU88_003081 [Pleurodeles waltl]
MHPAGPRRPAKPSENRTAVSARRAVIQLQRGRLNGGSRARQPEDRAPAGRNANLQAPQLIRISEAHKVLPAQLLSNENEHSINRLYGSPKSDIPHAFLYVLSFH